MRSCQLNRINIAYNKFPGYTGVYCSSQPTQTSFPGSLIFPLPLRASKERPGWLGLVTCLPESGRVQLNYWQEGCPSRNFVYTEPMGERDVSSPKYHKLGTIWCSVRNIDKCHHTVGTPNVMAAVENWLLWGGAQYMGVIWHIFMPTFLYWCNRNNHKPSSHAQNGSIFVTF